MNESLTQHGFEGVHKLRTFCGRVGRLTLQTLLVMAFDGKLLADGTDGIDNRKQLLDNAGVSREGSAPSSS